MTGLCCRRIIGSAWGKFFFSFLLGFLNCGFPRCLTRGFYAYHFFSGVVNAQLHGSDLACIVCISVPISYTNHQNSWADFYYIPRHLFADYIELADVFSQYKTFHEIAVPTMVNILDLTHRTHPTRSLISRLSDCFGGCCTAAEDPQWDVLWNRCGHKIDYQNPVTSEAQLQRLREETAMLIQAPEVVKASPTKPAKPATTTTPTAKPTGKTTEGEQKSDDAEDGDRDEDDEDSARRLKAEEEKKKPKTQAKPTKPDAETESKPEEAAAGEEKPKETHEEEVTEEQEHEGSVERRGVKWRRHESFLAYDLF